MWERTLVGILEGGDGVKRGRDEETLFLAGLMVTWRGREGELRQGQNTAPEPRESLAASQKLEEYGGKVRGKLYALAKWL